MGVPKGSGRKVGSWLTLGSFQRADQEARCGGQQVASCEGTGASFAGVRRTCLKFSTSHCFSLSSATTDATFPDLCFLTCEMGAMLPNSKTSEGWQVI